jgi:uncharacterized protein (TIGR00661 family)
MKLLYAIQGTGNGHLARAEALVPYLKKHFDQVDVLVSGFASDIQPSSFKIDYSKKGISFVFGQRGGINWRKTLIKNNFFRLISDILKLPVESYDLIVNDFEPVSAWAGKIKGKKVVAMSHQSALIGQNVPLPQKKYLYARTFLKWFAPFDERISFHFNPYDDHTFFPIIRDQIRTINPTVEPHYTVYLPAYEDDYLISILHQINEVSWEIFSKYAQVARKEGNCRVFPLDSQKFVQRFSSCTGIICGAGFETPAEAIFYGKKILVVPMKGQFEQDFNRAALKELGIPSLDYISPQDWSILKNWVSTNQYIKVDYPDQRKEILKRIKDFLHVVHTQQ